MYFFVAVREGSLAGGKLDAASSQRLRKIVRSLKQDFDHVLRSVDVIRFNGSKAGEATARRLARALGVKGIEASPYFGTRGRTTLKLLYDAIGRLENDGVHWINIVCLPGWLIKAYTHDAYALSQVIPQGEVNLAPGEGLVKEMHEDWGYEVSLTFLSQGREDVLTSTWRASLSNLLQQPVGW